MNKAKTDFERVKNDLWDEISEDNPLANSILTYIGTAHRTANNSGER